MDKILRHLNFIQSARGDQIDSDGDIENGQDDNVEDDDLQPHYKYLSLAHKQNVMMQRKIDVSSKKQMEQEDYVEHIDPPTQHKYNCTKDKNKISTRPGATVPASV